MSEMSNYLETKILDHILRNTAYTSPTTVYLALFTTACSDSALGTEVVGNGYSRQALAFSAASAGQIQNSADVSFTASGGNWGTIVAVAILDGSGNCLFYDNDFTDTAVNDGDTLKFAAGNITVAMD